MAPQHQLYCCFICADAVEASVVMISVCRCVCVFVCSHVPVSSCVCVSPSSLGNPLSLLFPPSSPSSCSRQAQPIRAPGFVFPIAVTLWVSSRVRGSHLTSIGVSFPGQAKKDHFNNHEKRKSVHQFCFIC